MAQAKKCAEKLHHFEGQIRYHNTREVATHEIRNTVTQGKGIDGQVRRTRGKFPVSVMPEVCLPMTAPGLRSSLPFRDGEGGHLYTADGNNYLMDEDGFWRLSNYVPSVTFDTCDDLSVVRSAGQAFGDFQMLLSDFDAEQLFYTIPDFHNTRKRYEKLKADMASDPCGRVSEVRDELDWLLSMEDEACRLTDLFNAGKLPLRVTHNDTKINNVLFDEKSREALVVIDLDTVMPGLVGHDFGDAIRFAANFVEEDCPQADKAGVNLNIYWAFAEGFIKETAATLTEAEVNTLGISCFALACELATRFLDDYILGDKYFKINYPEHNLVRTRCQIALAKDMRKKMDAMNAIARDCWMRYR